MNIDECTDACIAGVLRTYCEFLYKFHASQINLEMEKMYVRIISDLAVVGRLIIQTWITNIADVKRISIHKEITR